MKQGNIVTFRQKIAKADPRSMNSKAKERFAKVVSIGEERSLLSMPIKEKGKLILKIFEVLNDALPDLVQEVSKLTEYVKQLFQRIPNEIVYTTLEGTVKSYILTERKPSIDRLATVSYELIEFKTSLEDLGTGAFRAYVNAAHFQEAKSLAAARRQMKASLQSLSLL